ncbi:hypothetical protein BH23BAC1_BH23BAC1_17820 [soil metagenome]
MVSKDIIYKIQEAFSNVSYPGDDKIVYDNRPQHLECKAIAETFSGKHWLEMSDEKLRYNADSIFFFTADAFIYFLPAFMIFVLKDFYGSDTIPHTLVHCLSAPEESDTNFHKEKFFKIMNKLNEHQKEAIKAFLQFLKKEYPKEFPFRDIELALDSLKEFG